MRKLVHLREDLFTVNSSQGIPILPRFNPIIIGITNWNLQAPKGETETWNFFDSRCVGLRNLTNEHGLPVCILDFEPLYTAIRKGSFQEGFFWANSFKVFYKLNKYRFQKARSLFLINSREKKSCFFKSMKLAICLGLIVLTLFLFSQG